MNKTKRFTITVALGALAVGGLLAGCGTSGAGTATPAAQNQDAKSQFLAERGGTPGVMTDTFTMGVPGGAGGPPPGVVGPVESIDGSTLTVKNPMDGTTTKVTVAEDAKIRKQEEIPLSDIKVGDKVTAIGRKDGDVLNAVMVQVGGDGAAGGMAGGGPVMFFGGPGSGAGPGGGPPGGGIQSGSGNPGDPQVMPFGGDPNAVPGQMPQNISGTVDKVEDGKISVKAEDGTTTTVQPRDQAVISKHVDAQLSDIKVGKIITASGTQQGDTFEADGINIVGDAPMR
jgi:hypothetical protein